MVMRKLNSLHAFMLMMATAGYVRIEAICDISSA